MLTSGLKLNSRFTLEHRLGRGGMGDVWLINDKDSNEKRVAKLVPRDATDDRYALLQREERLTRRLEHPNIVRVYDLHHTKEYAFLTMAHIDGKPLNQLFGRPPAEVIQVSIRIAGALAHAHANGIVHRDLKPDNVRLDAEGQPHLLDFGIASSSEESPLRGGGTQGQISPQQLNGEAPQASDDIYALGALIYELITGELPIRAKAPGSTTPHRPPAPMVSNHPIPSSLEDLVGSMLAELPGDRPQSAAAVQDSLQAISEELESLATTQELPSKPPTLTPPTLKPPTLTPPSRRLAEPDRVIPPIVPPPSRRPTSTGRRQAAMWLTTIIFAVLGLAAIGVFVLLPEWVREQRQTEVVELVAEPAKRSVGAEIEESPKPQVTPQFLPEAELPGETQPAETQLGEMQPAETQPLAEGQPQPVARQPPDAQPQSEASPQASIREPGVAEPQPVKSASHSPEAPPEPHKAADAAAFEEAMTAGLAALNRKEFPAAHEAFQRAESVRPGSPQSRDGLARARTGLRLQTLTDLHQQAAALELDEAWRSAEERYQAALNLDPNVEFAQVGRERAAARAELSEELDFHLANPERLATDDVLQEASTTLAKAAEIQDAGPRLEKQVADLSQQITDFSTLLPMHLESDSLTDVVIYRVGRLGTFDQRAIELRPGTYTVIGSRRGYRDVRRQLVITPGVEPEPLQIRCEEEI